MNLLIYDPQNSYTVTQENEVSNRFVIKKNLSVAQDPPQ